ncbi:MAG: hypothetical protein J6S73_01330 [Lentisphaeria bacterium]|nr:hypothetical protein [Lentisphaeria bacterium]
MKYSLPVDPRMIDVVDQLQQSGYETYIVGGAIRDLLMGRRPKDYDISTAATPEQVREVFGRRSVRIIGRRFRLAHLHLGKEIIEISTFRRAPEGHGREVNAAEEDRLPENIILSDNDYGTVEEDARRRDFTVNALYFDPVREELLDFNGHSLDDIENGVVRAIGDPKLRFEEDPVRILRALKLVGQYDFSPDAETENAIFSSLDLIRFASPSRLSLELEKVLSSAYGDKHLKAFHDYGFLEYFLPFFHRNWNTEPMQYAMELFTERNYRVDEGTYRNSISLACAILALPFVEAAAGNGCGQLWAPGRDAVHMIRQILKDMFQPQNMINSVMQSAEHILRLQPGMYNMEDDGSVIGTYGYNHAREVIAIQNVVCWQDDRLRDFWPQDSSPRRKGGKRPPRRHKKKPAGGTE